jgi:hypothetical protein
MPQVKIRNGGDWTEERFYGFVKSGLRSLSMKWPPKYKVKTKARVDRGVYRCVGYKRRAHRVPTSLPPKHGQKRRQQNVFVDHIIPIIDVKKGFTTWDEVIERMFCEERGLQVLCKACHDKKTGDERQERKNKK